MAGRELRPRKSTFTYHELPPDKDPAPSSKPKLPQMPKKAAITKNHSAVRSAVKPTLKPTFPHSQLPDPPFFQPIKHSVPLHSACNTLPLALTELVAVEPIHLFKLFFNDDLFDTMAKNTNLYAEKKREGGRSWEEVTPSELRCWVGIIIYMGICRLPSIPDYWRHDGLWPTHHFSSYITQYRFEQIRRFFHISPPNAPDKTATGRRLWHQKVDPLLNQLRHASQMYRLSSSNIACDEAMIRCTGRSSDTYKIKTKPIPKGIKFHVAADHGYIFDFHPTSNKSGPDPFDEPSDFTNTSSVILQLVKHLPYQKRAFNVYMDNYYTNLPLFAELRKIGVGACGTARTTSKEFPTTLAVAKNTKLDYHYKAGVVDRGVAVLVWIDNGPVSMMTTIHQLKGRRSEVLKMRKKPGSKSTNATAIKKAAVFSEDEWRKEMMIPRCIDDYNHHMGGVDIADQYRSYYDTQLTSFRTWYPMFFWALDTTLTNCFIIWKERMGNTQPWNHKEFRMQVAWELILSTLYRSAEKRAEKRSLTQLSTPTQSNPHPPKRFYLTKNQDLPETASSGDHMPLHMGTRLDCIVCRWQRKQEEDGGEKKADIAKTVWSCGSCNFPLCLNERKNCYKLFHEPR